MNHTFVTRMFFDISEVAYFQYILVNGFVRFRSAAQISTIISIDVITDFAKIIADADGRLLANLI